MAENFPVDANDQRPDLLILSIEESDLTQITPPNLTPLDSSEQSDVKEFKVNPDIVRSALTPRDVDKALENLKDTATEQGEVVDEK